MKEKIIYILNFIWTGISAFTLPICFGIIYLDLSGHSKGYGYDLGAEKDVSVLVGCVLLIIWLLLVLPSAIYVFRRTMRRGRRYLAAVLLFYTALAAACIALTGGLKSYLLWTFDFGA